MTTASIAWGILKGFDILAFTYWFKHDYTHENMIVHTRLEKVVRLLGQLMLEYLPDKIQDHKGDKDGYTPVGQDYLGVSEILDFNDITKTYAGHQG